MPKQRFTTAEAEAIRAELAAGADKHEVAERWDASVSTIDRIAARINPYDQDEGQPSSLIPVFAADSTERSQLLCNARDLHAFLQIGRDFSNWIKNRIEQYGFEEGNDFICVENLSSPNLASSKARAQIMNDYHLTLDMAKELAMIENNEVGRRVRRYFIQMERQARSLLEARANRIQPIEQVKRKLKDTASLKFTLILQDQSRKIAKALSKETDHGVRYNLHCQLRQGNECLGVPTLSLAELTAGGLPSIE